MNSMNSGSVRNNNTWVAALLAVCLGILGYGVLYSTNSVSSPASLSGEYLVYALVWWGVFHSVFLRNRGTMINICAFVLIFLALFVGGLISAEKQKKKAVQAVSSLQQEMSRLLTEMTDSSGLPARVERGTTQPSTTSGEFGEIERFMNEFLNRLVMQRNDYLLELDAISWNSILYADRIRNDVGLSDSIFMIERAKTIVDKYEKKTSLLMQETRGSIESLNISQASKKEMLAGFERGMRTSTDQMNEQWVLEKQVVQQFENIIRLLAASKTWIVKGEQILFSTDEELALFNSYIQTIQDLTHKQEKIQKRGFAEAGQQMESLKNTLQK